MSEDPLVHVPINRWGELINIFKSDWPRTVSGFTVLESLKRILQLGLDYGFKVYCPYGDLSYGMVAINIKNTFYEVVVQIASDNTDKLEEALNNTKLIDWSQLVQVPFAPKHVMDCVNRVILHKKLIIDHITITETLILDKNQRLFEEISLPAEFTFQLLPLEYVEQVNSTWVHKHPGSTWYYELLIRAQLGYGLFKNNVLIAWIFIKEMGALGHLYTLEEHRRQGYGELVLKLISNILIKQGKYVIAFCVKGNTSAYKLYKKLGFQRTDEVTWCTMTTP